MPRLFSDRACPARSPEAMIAVTLKRTLLQHFGRRVFGRSDPHCHADRAFSPLRADRKSAAGQNLFDAVAARRHSKLPRL
jgi:hypothetical protein